MKTVPWRDPRTTGYRREPRLFKRRRDSAGKAFEREKPDAMRAITGRNENPRGMAETHERDYFRRWFISIFLGSLPFLPMAASAAWAVNTPSDAKSSAGPDSGKTTETSASPHQLVEEGNRLFLQGDIASAIEKYRQALPACPDSHELAFDIGLAHLQLGEYDAAKESLRKAALSKNRELADNARFALGLCDHAQALKTVPLDPSSALNHAQNAIRQYHDVLTHNPNHAAARDAWRKGAALWRYLQEQQPPASQSSQRDDDDSERPEQEPDQSEEQNPRQDQQSSPSSQDQSPESGDQNRDTQNAPAQQQDGPSREPESAEHQPSPQDDSSSPDKTARPQPSPQNDQNRKNGAESQEQPSRESMSADSEKKDSTDTLEHATRELRRLMDRQRLHERTRRTARVKPAAPPTGKDW